MSGKKRFDCVCDSCGAKYSFDLALNRKNLNQSQQYCSIVREKENGEFDVCGGYVEIVE